MIQVTSLVSISLASCTSARDSPDDTGRWGAVEVVEDLRIGDLEGPDEYMFGRIGHIAVGRDGSIYVADAQLVTIRQYDAHGVFLRNIGRRGEGPGEYSQILGMKVLADGMLAVLDVPHRIIMYQPNGEYQRDFRVPSTLHAPRMLEYDVSGNLYVKAADAERLAGGEEWSFVLVKISSRGEILGRIPLPREKRIGMSFVLYTAEGPLRYFTVSTRYAWSPLGYLVVGRNDEYSFDLIRADASPLRVSRRVSPVRVNSGEKAQWRAWADRFERRGLEEGRAVGFPAVPETKPAYKDLYVGDDGRIWVHRHVPAEKRDVPPREPGDDRPLLNWLEPSTFDAFEPDGTFLGTVVVPQETWIHVRRGRELWGVYTGAHGEQVVRLHIEAISG